jgi:hypothetical protein
MHLKLGINKFKNYFQCKNRRLVFFYIVSFNYLIDFCFITFYRKERNYILIFKFKLKMKNKISSAKKKESQKN